MEFTRREVIGSVIGAAAGIALSTNIPAFANTKKEDPHWIAHKLDPVDGANIGYESFYYNDHGCCFGAFRGIIGQMGNKYDAPYNNFPFHMMEVGKSGISEWGTICGALLGVASAWALFWGRKDRDPMVDELFSWYEKTDLPNYRPPKGFDVGTPAYQPPASPPTSVLCHVSVSKWCHDHDVLMKSKERSERCACMTGAVTAKAIEIMNEKIAQTQFAITEPSKARKTCGKCHATEKESDIAKGKMDCQVCHSGTLDNKFKDHP